MTEQMKEPKWIDWNGGDGYPVPAGHDTEILFFDGELYRNNTPEAWDWEKAVGGIKAYRDWTAFNNALGCSTSPSKCVSNEGDTSLQNQSENVLERKIERSRDISEHTLLLDLLFDQEPFNGHLQTIISQAKLSDIQSLIETIDASGRIRDWCELRMTYLNGKWEGSIYAVDEWRNGEHKDGHKDKLLLGIERIIV